MPNSVYDVLIIGGGPAGYTAGLYASRYGLKTLCLEGWQPGGWLTTTTLVENFPGFKEGIMGPALMLEMRAQAERFGVEFIQKEVTSVDLSKHPFKASIEDRDFEARSVILATGSRVRKLGLPSEERLWGKGVSTCATCDGFFYRGKTVAVVGGGDTAMEEATFLTQFATKVTLLNRTDRFRASSIMLERARKNPKIEIQTHKTVEDILGDPKVSGLRLKDVATGTVSEIPADGLFLAIGHLPSTEFLGGQVALDPAGYVLVKEAVLTSVPGVFAAGECADHHYRQAIVAAGDGCRAAMDAKRWLDEQA